MSAPVATAGVFEALAFEPGCEVGHGDLWVGIDPCERIADYYVRVHYCPTHPVPRLLLVCAPCLDAARASHFPLLCVCGTVLRTFSDWALTITPLR